LYAESINDIDRIKGMLLNHINEYPGIRYRELLRLTGHSNGVLSYHLSILEKSNKIRVDRRKNRITRYYLSSVTSNESEVLGYVRHNIARQIIIFLLDHDLCTFNEIVDHTQKAPSTISWHLKRLRDSGLVSILFGNDYQLYRVINSTVVRAVIYKYKESFVDSTVNNFTEMMEEL